MLILTLLFFTHSSLLWGFSFGGWVLVKTCIHVRTLNNDECIVHKRTFLRFLFLLATEDCTRAQSA